MKPSLSNLTLFAFVFLIGTIFSSSSFAFPEMVRHAYVNCNSCHVSQTGGGILTEYGRELSKELLSTWKNKDENSKEQNFAYDLVSIPKWLNMGGDVRSVYVYKDDKLATQGRLILMQADLEAAATYKKFTFDLTGGYQSPKSANTFSDYLISRRHFLNYAASDVSNVRVGRFIPAFGINTPDHVSLTRTGLGFGQGFESYNLEGSYIGEKYNLFLTGIFGRLDDPTLDREQGGAVQGSIAITDSAKIGLNYLYGKKKTSTRHVYGIFGLLGITKDLSLLSEFDLQNKNSSSLTSFGVATTQKLSYEANDGVWLFLTQEWSKLNFENIQSGINVFGAGVQFFPRTHFEFNVSWERQQILALSDRYFDYAWVMSHFYF
jgi:hypothetical protein